MSNVENIINTDNIKLSEDGSAVVILDQSRLPNETEYLKLDTAKGMYEAILHLRVRGAPAIGIFAAYSMYILALNAKASDRNTFLDGFKADGEYLKSSRPTAVNLAWAVDRMIKRAECLPKSADVDFFRNATETLRLEALKIHNEDIAMCTKISEYGLELISDGDGILTHCNAGPLATSKYGTALGPILLGKERGMNFKVFADETRPLLQGARLTSYELHKAGVDVTLICDNMASMVMKNGWINACLVGCDRVAANGDTANKIGTSGVAVLANHYGIPLYVLGPTSTIDLECASGDDIPIELRTPEEIKEKFYQKPSALSDVKCYNPAFDVTDNRLITAIVTEAGICKPPFSVSLKRAKEKTMMNDRF